MLLLVFLFIIDYRFVSHRAHLIFVTISVRHLREPLSTVFTLVGRLPAMHVNMVFNVIQLGVSLTAVLALEQLIWSSGAEVRLEPLDVAAVVAVGVYALFSVHFGWVYVGLLACDILFKVKVSFDGDFGRRTNCLRLLQWERLCIISVVNYGVHLSGHLADEGHQDGLISA